MAALAEVIPHPAAGTPVEVDRRKAVVAVVLEDGSIRDLRVQPMPGTPGRISHGSLSGADWILWWERRSF